MENSSWPLECLFVSSCVYVGGREMVSWRLKYCEIDSGWGYKLEARLQYLWVQQITQLSPLSFFLKINGPTDLTRCHGMKVKPWTFLAYWKTVSGHSGFFPFKGLICFYSEMVLMTVAEMPALCTKCLPWIVLIFNSYVRYKFTDIKSAIVMNMHVLSSEIMKV